MFVQNFLLPIIYKIYSRKPIDKDLVIFADAHNSEIPYSMKLMKEKISQRKFNIEVCYTDYQSGSYIKIIFEMIRFMKLYAKAKYVFRRLFPETAWFKNYSKFLETYLIFIPFYAIFRIF